MASSGQENAVNKLEDASLTYLNRKAFQPCDTWGLRAAKPCCRYAPWWHFCFANPV